MNTGRGMNMGRGSSADRDSDRRKPQDSGHVPGGEHRHPGHPLGRAAPAAPPARPPVPAPATHVQLPQRSLREGTQLSVVCEKLDASGCGVARCLDQLLGEALIQVPNLLPGERAHVKVGHVSPHVSREQGAAGGQRTAFATLMRRHNAAAERQIPACAAFGQCGGCTLQHLTYEAQLRFKREVVGNALAARAGAQTEPSAGVAVAPCVPSPQPLYYRSRVKLIAAPAPLDPGQPEPGATRIILGAYAPRSHRVIDMAGCKVNTPALRAVARTLAEQWGHCGLSVYDEGTGSGALRYVLLREVRSGAVQVSLVVAAAPPPAPLQAVVAALRAAHPQLQSVVLHHNSHPGNALLGPTDRTDGSSGGESELGPDQPLFGPLFLDEELGETGSLPVRVSAQSFLQVNRAVASQLYADVAAALPVAAGQTVIDLYCGVGGLGRSVLLAAPGARLIGIEANPSAVADAEHSARAAGLTSQQARFLCGAVEDHLPGLLAPGAESRAAVVLLNPPRRGCTKGVLEAILAGAPRHIAYVSCNPQSLGRDLLALTAAGYKVTQVTPYDMHPGTPHIETLALLARYAD